MILSSQLNHRNYSMIMRKQEAAVLLNALFFYITTFCHSYASGSSELITINNCTCEGYDQIYECRITGSGATVWMGTAFDCSNNEITFLHSSPNIGVEKTCNDGAIVGRLIRAENNTYVSQLTVSVSAQTVGTSISCSHDSTGTHLIGSSVPTLSTGPYPPPSDVHLLDINSTHLTFHWSPVSSNCNAVHYRITSSNCGHCPNTTNYNFITCTGPFINGQLCSFAVQTVVCDDVVGNESNRVQVVIRMPSAPMVNVIPTYSHTTKRLIALTTQFNELESFNISEGVDGSASSYTITYTDSTTGVACASATVLASSCVNKSCEYKFELPFSSCLDSTEILVQVSGTNRLGNGILSKSVLVQGVTNQFVDLSFNPASRITTCLFLHQPKVANEKLCSIVYGVSGETCAIFSRQSSKSSSDKVYLGFPEANHIQSQKECCFIATGSNGTFTVSVEGSMLTTPASTSKFKFTIGMLPFGAAMGATTLIIIIITITFILITVTLVRSRRAVCVDLERLKAKAIEQPAAIYEELDYVHMAPKPASPPTIDTGQNTAYLSFSGLFSRSILS